MRDEIKNGCSFIHDFLFIHSGQQRSLCYVRAGKAMKKGEGLPEVRSGEGWRRCREPYDALLLDQPSSLSEWILVV